MFEAFVEEQALLFVALAVIVAMLVYSYLGDKISGIQSVSADEAVRLYNRDAWVLDVRSEGEYKTGFIGQAENISSTEIKSKVDSIMSHKDEVVLVYCQSGARSAAAAKVLAKAGFTNVNNLSGGIANWKAAGLPTNTQKSLRKQKKTVKEKKK